MDEDFHKQTTLPDLHAGERSYPLPQKIGPYKIESLLNKGGMSLLYLGIHPKTSEPIAIKVLVPKYVKNKEAAGRFLKEAQIIGMTSHPNIVKLYGQGQWERGLYIAMELVRGVSLRQFIRQKSLSQKRALEIVLQVAYALCHLHTHGVIHRDVKPENVLITETGEIKVIDFGIAQFKEEIPQERIEGRLIGTPSYMSPEQREHPEKVTFGSDVYSLGVIAYELILGRQSHGTFHFSLLPKTIRGVIEKALKADPKERYQDVVDFITDVSEALARLSSEKEEKSEEISEDVLDMIQRTRAILIRKKAPRWPQLEFGIAVQEGISLSGLYLDFFRLSENRLAIALAEPSEAGVSSLLHSSILRGMCRMAVEHYFQNGKKDQHPVQMLHALNRALCEDPMKQKFAVCFLILHPDRDQLSFVSCGYSQLWHVPEGTKKIRALSTPNPLLGADANASLLETADNWNSGDLLILRSSLSKNEEIPNGWIGEHLLLSPQNFSEKLIEKFSRAQPARASAVLTIQRIF